MYWNIKYTDIKATRAHNISLCASCVYTHSRSHSNSSIVCSFSRSIGILVRYRVFVLIQNKSISLEWINDGQRVSSLRLFIFLQSFYSIYQIFGHQFCARPVIFDCVFLVHRMLNQKSKSFQTKLDNKAFEQYSNQFLTIKVRLLYGKAVQFTICMYDSSRK